MRKDTFDIQDFFDRFLIPSLKEIDSRFFNVPVLEKTKGAVKTTHPERVFCYELYHQLRKKTGSLIDYDLHGELSKVNHPLFEKNKKIPDFILHKPGDMENNLLVMEIKGCLTSDIKKDFETLIGFIRDQQYEFGIFIIFGVENSSFLDFVLHHSLIPDCSKEIQERILIVVQSKSYAEPNISFLKDLTTN